MAALALVLAAVAAAGAALPGGALYVGLAAGILALVAGRQAYRARTARPSRRLLGAAASALGGLALVLCLVRYALIVAALGRLDALVG
jgi:hypothetical protein